MDRARLSAIRERIESLASEGGEYYVVCGRTGERPVPVAQKRFPDRGTAATAAQAATTYRAMLRQYDSRTRVHDFIVCQAVDTAERSPDAVTTPSGEEGSA